MSEHIEVAKLWKWHYLEWTKLTPFVIKLTRLIHVYQQIASNNAVVNINNLYNRKYVKKMHLPQLSIDITWVKQAIRINKSRVVHYSVADHISPAYNCRHKREYESDIDDSFVLWHRYNKRPTTRTRNKRFLWAVTRQNVSRMHHAVTPVFPGPMYGNNKCRYTMSTYIYLLL